jgi:hypothetical protein
MTNEQREQALRLADALANPRRWHELKDAQCDEAAALLRTIAAEQKHKPMTEGQIQELCCAVDASGARPAATSLIRAVERFHGIE